MSRPTGTLHKTPQYINDFSKALSTEVRILLQEVGKLRDERRALQFEISQLMAMKSQHGPGGEFQPNWKPSDPPPAPPEEEPAPPPPAPEDPVAAKPGWRTIEQTRPRGERKRRHGKALAPAEPAFEEPLPPPPPQHAGPSWASWKPNPHVVPASLQRPPPINIPPPARGPPGLFGPPSP